MFKPLFVLICLILTPWTGTSSDNVPQSTVQLNADKPFGAAADERSCVLTIFKADQLDRAPVKRLEVLFRRTTEVQLDHGSYVGRAIIYGPPKFIAEIKFDVPKDKNIFISLRPPKKRILNLKIVDPKGKPIPNLPLVVREFNPGRNHLLSTDALGMARVAGVGDVPKRTSVNSTLAARKKRVGDVIPAKAWLQQKAVTLVFEKHNLNGRVKIAIMGDRSIWDYHPTKDSGLARSVTLRYRFCFDKKNNRWARHAVELPLDQNHVSLFGLEDGAHYIEELTVIARDGSRHPLRITKNDPMRIKDGVLQGDPLELEFTTRDKIPTFKKVFRTHTGKKPVPGVSIRIVLPGAMPNDFETDSDGKASIRLPEGTYTAFVRKKGYQPMPAIAFDLPGKKPTLDVALKPYEKAHGRVLFQNRPVASARVLVFYPDKKESSVRANAKGEYSFKIRKHRTAFVGAMKSRNSVFQFRKVALKAHSFEHNIELTREKDVEFKVELPKPLTKNRNQRLYILSAGKQPAFYSATFGDRKKINLSGPEGKYRVYCLIDDAMYPASEELEIPGDQLQTLKIRDKPVEIGRLEDILFPSN